MRILEKYSGSSWSTEGKGGKHIWRFLGDLGQNGYHGGSSIEAPQHHKSHQQNDLQNISRTLTKLWREAEKTSPVAEHAFKVLTKIKPFISHIQCSNFSSKIKKHYLLWQCLGNIFANII